MAETMQFDLVSPERRLASLAVKSVQIPGADGDLTAMPNHAPLITTLRAGILRVESDKGSEDYVVTGGFAQIGESLSVLAEQAMPRAEVTQDVFDAMMADVRAELEAAKGNQAQVDAAAKRVADVQAVGSALGLTAR